MHPTPAVTDAQLRALVETFYARVRQDPALGPVFAEIVQDWPEHLDKLSDFWSSVMRGSGRYHGNPLQAHRRLGARLSPALFTRWLALWAETSTALLPPAAATAIQSRASLMAANLQRGCGLVPAAPAP